MLFRVSLVSLGAALALAGCEGATPVDKAEPDTAPEFSGSVANQTYKALQDIDALTLPRATGGNGDLSYSLEPDPPPDLAFDPRTRTLSGKPLDPNEERVYQMTYRVLDSDDNSSSRDADTLRFTITVRPNTILEQMVSSVAVGDDVGRLVYRSLPDPSGGPAIDVSGSDTMVAGGAFFLDVVPAAGAGVDTLLVAVQGEESGYYEIGLDAAASSYRLVGLVPHDLDRTRSKLDLCVAARYALDRVGAAQCHNLKIAEVTGGVVQVTLSWDADSDVDLRVLDPDGAVVGKGTLRRGTDQVRDANAACAGAMGGAQSRSDDLRNEYVAWIGSAQPGVYTVEVDYRSSCGVPETEYVLTVNNAGETSTFSGTLTGAGDYRKSVTTFTVPESGTPPELGGGKTLSYDGGDQAFILNPDGEILDAATFTLRLGQAGAEVYVIATNTAHHPMNPQVEQLGRAGRSAAGRLAQAAAESIAMVPQRSWVTEFNNSAELPTAGACGQQQTTRPGNTHTFLDYDESLDQVVRIPATKRNEEVTDGTTTLTVWVADASWDARRVSCVECVSQEMVDAVANQFLLPNERNDVYGLVTAVYGAPWGSHDRPCLIPDQASVELHILLYDVDGDLRDDVPDEQRTRGFFAAKDNYLRIASDPITASSNERLLLYLDAPLLAQADDPAAWRITDHWPRQMISTLVHELQHMIHFFQKRVLLGGESAVWLNEMASAVAEDLVAGQLRPRIIGLDGPRAVAYNDPTVGSPGNSDGPLPFYNLHNDVDVTDWDGTLRSSSTAYALGAYLARTYGGAALFRDIVQSNLDSIEAIEAAARVRHTFADMLVNWAIANLLSDNDGLPDTEPELYYRYNTGDWSTAPVGGVTFQLGSINLYNYRYESDSVTQEGPFLYSLDGFNQRTQPPHSNMYATLGRNSGTVRLRVSAVEDNRITVVVKE